MGIRTLNDALTPLSQQPVHRPNVPVLASPSYVRFPAKLYASRQDFDTAWHETKTYLDTIYERDRALGTAAQSLLTEGTCGPCGRVTSFASNTAGGDVLPDGRTVPNWREQAVCACPRRLNSRFRATLHYLQSVVGVSTWTKLVIFGPVSSLNAPCTELMPLTRSVRRMTLADDLSQIPLTSGSAHVIVAPDVLNFVPPVDDALAEFRRILIPGGTLALTLPFHYDRDQTVSRLDGLVSESGQLPPHSDEAVHEFGWDLLPRLRRHGFRRVIVHCYRSEELGYYGVVNVLISAET